MHRALAEHIQVSMVRHHQVVPPANGQDAERVDHVKHQYRILLTLMGGAMAGWC